MQCMEMLNRNPQNLFRRFAMVGVPCIPPSTPRSKWLTKQYTTTHEKHAKAGRRRFVGWEGGDYSLSVFRSH